MYPRVLLAKLLLAMALSVVAPAASAADILPPPPPDRPIELVEQTTRTYLENRAVLLSIRAAFNILAPDDIEPALIADLEQMTRNGPSQAQLDELALNLLTEGSYYLVSLEYVVRAGGAAWPDDRPAVNYDNDALVQLDALKRSLLDIVETQADPLPVFVEAQRIMALTNGEKDIPPAADAFAGRDAMVKRALDLAAPWTST
jgi:hypothetical protein